MQASVKYLVCILSIVLVVSLCGCNRGDDGTRAQPLAASIAVTGPAPTASVNLSLRLDAPHAAVRADTLPGSVSVKLTSINIGDVANPTTVQEATAAIGIDYRASVSFANVPLMPTLCEVTLTNGQIGTFTSFRGATDIVAGPNTIVVNGNGSRLVHDITASVIQRVLSSPALRSKVTSGFVAAARQTIQGLAAPATPGYDEAAAMVVVKHLEPPIPATLATFPTLTNASLAGKWVMVELDGRLSGNRSRHAVLEVFFDGVGRMTWREIWSSKLTIDSTVGSTAYSVAADGEVTLGIEQRYTTGVIYTDGRRFCYTSWDHTDARNAIAIRQRTGVTLGDLAGTWRGACLAHFLRTSTVLTITGTSATSEERFRSDSGTLVTAALTGLSVDTQGLLTSSIWGVDAPTYTDGDLIVSVERTSGGSEGVLTVLHRAVTGLSNASIAGRWRALQFYWEGSNCLHDMTYNAAGTWLNVELRNSNASATFDSSTGSFSVPTDGDGTGGTNAPAWHTDGRTIIEVWTQSVEEAWLKFYMRRP